MAQSRRTKALAITPAVKKIVYERDGGCCVWCGAPGLPEAHYIPRSKSGLGIEENILTLCRPCHMLYDQSGRAQRDMMGEYFRHYLKQEYPDWDEKKLYYKKEI